MVRQYFNAKKRRNTEISIPKTEHFKSKLQSILSKRKNEKSWFKKMIILGVLIYFWSVSLSKALDAKDFKSFDPYALLEIDSSATDKEIKKAYRKLVKLYHPDKNPGNREALNMFLQVTKAYQCLTDPETKEVCAQYGNPDGNSSYEVGVAIPSVFLKQENTKLILSFFFLMLFLGTLIYLISLQSSENLNEFGVSQETLRNCFKYFKNENMIFKNVVEMMSISQELRTIITCKQNQIKDMNRIRDLKLKTSLSNKEFQIFQKPFYLIHHHMRNDEPLPPSLQSDILLIQEKSLGLFISFFELGFEIVQMSTKYKQIWEKPLSPRVLQTLCCFAQHFTQGMFINESPLLQLPFINRSNVKRISNKLKLPSFKELLPEDSQYREKLFDLTTNSEKEKVELIQALDCFSQFDMSIRSFVDLGEGEEDPVIRHGDIFTMEINIERKNQNVGYIYSQKLDFLKLERISILIYFKKNKHILYYETKFTKEKNHKITFQREFPVSGEFELVVLVESDSYVGVGLQQEYILKVEKPVKKDEYYLHPDDEEALSKPSFIMSLLTGALEDQIDSDDELEEGEEDEEEEEEQNLVNDEKQNEKKDKKVDSENLEEEDTIKEKKE
jgi:translocation protein SEC63